MLVADERQGDTGVMVDPKAFALRFKRRRMELGYTFRDIARQLGVAWQSVSGWENGSLPRPRRFADVARVMQMSPEELFYGETRKPPETKHLPVLKSREEVPIMELRERHRVPIVPWDVAGNWLELGPGFHPGDALGWLYVTVGAVVGEGAFAIRVTGDAMANTSDRRNLPDGALVAIDPEIKPEHDRIVLTKQAGHTLLRLLWLDGDTPYLRPLNDKYPMVPLAPDATIIGVAFQATKDL